VTYFTGADMMEEPFARSPSVYHVPRLKPEMVDKPSNDHTLAADFYAAMARIEQSLRLHNDALPVTSERESLLALADQLAEPQLCNERRFELVAQLRSAECVNGSWTPN
jgi:hypothetical protein